jgi:hypothetical protein
MKLELRIKPADKNYINLLDQVFEIEQKLEVIKEPNSIERNISKIKDIFASIYATPSVPNCGLFYRIPIMGDDYDETKTDLDASIAGESTKNLVITEVIKPIIRSGKEERSLVIRNGVVVVESKANEKEIEK